MSTPSNFPQRPHDDEETDDLYRSDPDTDPRRKAAEREAEESASAIKDTLGRGARQAGGNLLGQAIGGGLRGALGHQLGGMLDNAMQNAINDATGQTSGGASGGTQNAVDEDAVYEMLWNCRFCGSEKLLGKTHRFCPACGSPQDPEWRYYPADDEKIAVKDHHYVGADKVCPACSTLNAADAEFCPRCGSPQTDAQAVTTQALRAAGNEDFLDREDLHTRLDAQAAQRVSGLPQTASASGSGFRWTPKNIALIVVAIALVFGGIYVFTAKKSTSVVLDDKQWDREIEIEKLMAVSDSSVCSSMPGDAYSVTRRREQVDTRRVQDGETCSRQQVDRGDGTFREQQVCSPTYREEPVYGDVCYYTIDRWRTARTATSSGAADVQPYWAQANISRGGACVGCEREGNRREVYKLIFTGDGGSRYECDVNASIWEAATIESVWSLEVGQFTNAPDCSTLARAS